MKKLKNKILQLAIQGKLVSNDCTEDISHNECSISSPCKDAKPCVSSKKPLKPISPDEIPFDIPDNWKWVRLGEVVALSDSVKSDGKQILLEAKFLRGKIEPKYLDKGRFIEKGENVILVDGENSGEVFTAPCDGYLGSTFKKLMVNQELNLQYVLNFILINKEYLRKSKKGSAIPHLDKNLFFNLLIPLPPLSIQHRIVSKVEELFSMLESIKF